MGSSLRRGLTGSVRPVVMACLALACAMLAPGLARAADSWAPAASMGTPRGDHTATLLADGQVLAVGGRDADFAATKLAERYAPVTNGWSPAGTMATARSFHTATRLNDGRVLVTGGYAGGVL